MENLNYCAKDQRHHHYQPPRWVPAHVSPLGTERKKLKRMIEVVFTVGFVLTDQPTNAEASW